MSIMCLPAARARAARGAPRGSARSRPLERPPARYTVWRGEKRTGFSPFYTNTSRTSTENNTRSNTSSSAPFCGHLRCVFSVVDPGLCGSTNTERAASRATAQNKKKSRLVVETERAVEWGLRPALSIRHDDVSWPANRTHLVLCAAGERGVKQRRHTEAGGKQNCVPKRVRVPFRQAWR